MNTKEYKTEYWYKWCPRTREHIAISLQTLKKYEVWDWGSHCSHIVICIEPYKLYYCNAGKPFVQPKHKINRKVFMLATKKEKEICAKILKLKQL